MKKLVSHLLISTQILLLSVVNLSAQGLTFTDKAEYEAAICGSVSDNDFGDVSIDGTPLRDLADQGIVLGPLVFPTTWGQIETTALSANAFTAVNHTDGTILSAYLFGNGNVNSTNTWIPDPSFGAVEGFLISYTSTDDFEIEVYDGSTLVETITVPATDQTATEPNSFGWINSQGVNATSFSIGDTSP